MLSKEFHHHSNSQTIREKHPLVFKALYQACTTVVSAPATTVWSPTYAVGPGGIGIVSKIPYRLHIGVEPTTSPGVQFGPTKYYIPERDEFEDWDITRCNPLLLKVLESVAKKYGKGSGARLWCVSEIPWYRGLNVDPLYAVPCATAWLLHLGAVSPEDIAEFVHLPTDKLSGSSVFEKVFRLAWKLDSIIANWISDGHLTFGTLIDSQYPVVFFREKDPFLFDHYRDLGVDTPSSYYNASDNLFYRGVRFDELFALDPNPMWPIDMALVFTGEEGDSRLVYQSRGAVKTRLDEVASFSEKSLQGFVPPSFRQTPSFLELAHDSTNQSAGMNLYQSYRRTSVAHSMSVLKDLYNLFQYGVSAETLREFLSNQSVCQHILRVLGLSPYQLSSAMQTLRLVGTKRSEVGVSCRLIGPGNHGCIMVIGQSKTLEPILNEALPLLKDNNRGAVHCHYASWCDGASESAGARVEQHVASKNYSAYTAAESITVREMQGAAPGQVLLFTTDKFATERERYDLLLDAREGKVRVRGKRLTSDEIHSAKQTIELIRQFVERRIEEIKAVDLPASIYSADRNQMESKIVRPIASAVKDATGRPLGLEIHGGLAANFTVSFRPDKHLRIGLVEKT